MFVFWRFSHCRYLRSFVATSHSPALQAFEYLESMSIRQFKKVYLHSRNYQWNLKITLEKGKSPTKPTKPLGFILLGAQPLRKKFGLATPSSQSVIKPRLPSIRQELWATWDESKSHAIRNIHIYIYIHIPSFVEVMLDKCWNLCRYMKPLMLQIDIYNIINRLLYCTCSHSIHFCIKSPQEPFGFLRGPMLESPVMKSLQFPVSQCLPGFESLNSAASWQLSLFMAECRRRTHRLQLNSALVILVSGR